MTGTKHNSTQDQGPTGAADGGAGARRKRGRTCPLDGGRADHRQGWHDYGRHVGRADQSLREPRVPDAKKANALADVLLDNVAGPRAVGHPKQLWWFAGH